MKLPLPRNNWRWLLATVLVIGLDQATKYAIQQSLALYQSIWLMPWLNLVSLRNTGAAFSMFSGAPSLSFVILACAVSLGILIWLWRNPHGHGLQAAALCLIMGGAIGNAIDRVAHGYVVDFVDFHVGDWHFAAFNLADSAITIGAILLLLDLLIEYLRRGVDVPRRR